MQAIALSLTARTLYAELRELALAQGIAQQIGETPGTLVSKTLRGTQYRYYQYRDLDGRTRQAYLGAAGSEADRIARRIAVRASEGAEDRARLEELRAAFLGAGGTAMEQAPLRVLQAFADSGVLRPAPGYAVLVGTHAFNVLGNALGVRWASRMQTQDIDIAGEADIDLAVPRPESPPAAILDQLDMGFIPVPALDPRAPSTAYRVRGKELRVDLLTPLRGKSRAKPVFVPALNSVAEPLRHLDYLLVEPVPVVVVGKRMLVVLNVPAPERFALHKLLLAESRPAMFASKATKDRLQAMQMLGVLIAEAPDGLADAWHDLKSRGAGWAGKLHRALAKCATAWPDTVAWVRALTRE